MTELLTDRLAFTALCDAISAAPWVGLDTEFVRERTYFAELCLIQVALPGALFLVDPLGADMRPLARALQGPGVKIFHAGRQDLELLLQDTGELPAPVFDTQMAAALVGQDEQIGYGNLVALRLHIDLNKDATRTNWALRPLSARQLAYAEDDVRHLYGLYEGLTAELAHLGRLDWLAEDCGALANPSLYRFSIEQLARRYRQGANLSARGQAQFQALLMWRENAAIAANLPRGWVVSDALLFDLAAHPPKTTTELSGRRGFEAPRMDSLKDAILETLLGADDHPTYAWARPTLNPEEEEIYTGLQTLVDARAKELAIHAGVICSKRALKEITQGAPPGALAQGWRAQILGDEGARLLARLAELT